MGSNKSKAKKSAKKKKLVATESTRTRSYSETTHTTITSFTAQQSSSAGETIFLRAERTRTSLPTQSFAGSVPKGKVRGAFANLPTSAWQTLDTSFLDQPGPPLAYDAKPFEPQNLPTPFIPVNRSTTIPIKIRKKDKRFDINPKIPTYQTFGRKRGMALIINNINFKDKPEMTRHGAEADEKNLYELFTKLDITPKLVKDQTKAGMEETLARFAANEQLKKVDLCFVVVMSHGQGDETVTQLTGTDHKLLDTVSIINHFSNENCIYLKKKPKIFVFQCCRGNAEYQNDAHPSTSQCEDMLLAYSTLPGYVAGRDTQNGTYFIQQLCKVFMEDACEHHITDMLIKIQGEMQKMRPAQTCSYENKSFKRCYLHPM